MNSSICILCTAKKLIRDIKSGIYFISFLSKFWALLFKDKVQWRLIEIKFVIFRDRTGEVNASRMDDELSRISYRIIRGCRRGISHLVQEQL